MVISGKGSERDIAEALRKINEMGKTHENVSLQKGGNLRRPDSKGASQGYHPQV